MATTDRDTKACKFENSKPMLVTDPHFSLEREEQKKARRDEIRGLDTTEKDKEQKNKKEQSQKAGTAAAAVVDPNLRHNADLFVATLSAVAKQCLEGKRKKRPGIVEVHKSICDFAEKAKGPLHMSEVLKHAVGLEEQPPRAAPVVVVAQVEP